MAINKVDTKKEKKAAKAAKRQERKAEKAARTESKKYCDKSLNCGWAGIASGLVLLVTTVIHSMFEFRMDLLIVTAVEAVIFGVLMFFVFYFANRANEEAEKEEENERSKKEDLIKLLNATDFKEIKLKKSENKYFNAFLNNTIKAKIHSDNDEIIVVKFCFIDEAGLSHSKQVPFSREHLIATIDDVIDQT